MLLPQLPLPKQKAKAKVYSLCIGEYLILTWLAVLSSCLAGTNLTGLAILKNENDPIAKKDIDYPPWLWTILTEGKVSDLAKEPRQLVREGQEFDFDREKRRLAAVLVGVSDLGCR